jgi:putative DNA primase/helicase
MIEKNGKNQIETTGVELICASDLEPEPIQWLWENWLAAGKFHILAGAPGTGKTTIALNLAAIITAGGQWPGGGLCEPGNVLIWSGEDDPKDTLLPRLLAHFADRNRIYFVSGVFEQNKPRAFDPARDMPSLYEKALNIGGVKMIIIDPIVNVISGDSHKNGEVRRDLQPLVELGQKLKAVILGISHFNKGSALTRDPLERVTGSIAFGALARIVLVTAKLTDVNGNVKRILIRAKSNNGPDGGGYHYQIEQAKLTGYEDIFSSKIIWGEHAEGTPHELLMDINIQEKLNKNSAFAEAVSFLKDILSKGAVPKHEVDNKAKDTGIKDITLRRAKSFLKVQTIHEGYGLGSIWKWSLPPAQPPKTIEDLQEREREKERENLREEEYLLDKLFDETYFSLEPNDTIF